MKKVTVTIESLIDKLKLVDIKAPSMLRAKVEATLIEAIRAVESKSADSEIEIKINNLLKQVEINSQEA